MKQTVVILLISTLVACNRSEPAPASPAAMLTLTVAVTQAALPTDTPPRLPAAKPRPMNTSTPMPTFTPTALPVPRGTLYPDQSAACTRPPDDMTRVQINGETISARTRWMLELAQHLYGGPGSMLRVTQGSNTPGLEESFGTHDGGGAVDISIRNPANLNEVLFEEAPKMVTDLRQAGFAAWYRPTGVFGPNSTPHIHAIAIGDPDLAPAARRQIDGPEGYLLGWDGIPPEYGGPHTDPHGGPIICPWMLEMGYQHLPPQDG